MQSLPSVAVYVTAETIFVISQQITDFGRVSIEPMFNLDRGASHRDVGDAVLACMAEFEDVEGAPDPDHLQGLLEFVGAKSWTPFAKRAVNVSVEGISKNQVSLAVARASGRGAYAYGESHSCAREPEAIGKLLMHLVESE